MALKSDSNSEKYLLRKTRCLINLGKDLSEVIEMLPNSNEKTNLLAERARIEGQKVGRYDYFYLLKHPEEITEYIGPIEIKFLGPQGRGVVATEDIKKGDLIMVEKAFSINNHVQSITHELEQQLIY
jgi:hypothetical protein